MDSANTDIKWTIEQYEQRIATLEAHLDEMTVALTHAWNQLVPFLQNAPNPDATGDLEPILQSVIAAVDVPRGGIYLLETQEWITQPHELPTHPDLKAYLQKVASEVPFSWRFYEAGRAEWWLFAPIITDDEIIGYIGIACDDGLREFTEAERRILVRMSERAAGQIGALKLAEMRQREAAARRELEIASHIQRSIQPKTAPSVPGLQVAFYWEPARQVGGDACGWFVQPDGTLNWFILDVSGKGLPAALAAVSLYTAIRVGLRLGQTPDAILRLANEEFYAAFTEASLMATVAVFSLDPATGLFTQSSAGHPPTLIRQECDWTRLLASVPPLGVLEAIEPTVQEIQLQPYDVVIAYSNGFTEITVDEGDTLWGEDGVRSVMPQGAKQAEELVTYIVEAAHHLERDQEPADDKTLFIVGFGETNEAEERQ